MWTIVLTLLVIFVVVIPFLAASKPDTYTLHRSRLIKAPESKVFPLIANFREWTKWSPWENVEGDELQRKYGGAAQGEGATYDWEGKKTGVGRMEIVETIGMAEVKIKLDFFKPMEAHNTATFVLIEEPEGTLVTWTMVSPQTFLFKLMGVFMNPDKMMGPSFDKGLANLAAVAEKP